MKNYSYHDLYFNSGNVEGALIELKVAINNIDLTASKIKVVDSGGLYTGTNAETCLAEVMNKVKTAQARADSAFTSANNGKTSVASVVGNLTSSNTFSQITSEIQTNKNILATNLTNKGVTASGNDTLRNLVGLVDNITQITHYTNTNHDTNNFSYINSNGGFELTLANLFASRTIIYGTITFSITYKMHTVNVSIGSAYGFDSVITINGIVHITPNGSTLSDYFPSTSSTVPSSWVIQSKPVDVTSSTSQSQYSIVSITNCTITSDVYYI